MPSDPPSSQLGLHLGLPRYAELFCLSNFSFLQGASHAEELVARAVQLGYAALAVTDECSLAGVVRAHAEAKGKLPLIIGAHFHLEHPDGTRALSLILLAQNRNGYGNLSELITLGRTRSEKGTYLLRPADLESGVPDCLAILLPAYPGHDQPGVDRLHVQAAWLSLTFPGRAWIGLNLLHRAFDDAHRATVEEVGWQHGLPIVAVGHVVMHVRSRKPLQDTLTRDADRQAGGRMRLRSWRRTPSSTCARACAWRTSIRARALDETLRIAARCTLLAGRAALRIPARNRARRATTPPATCAAKPMIGAHRRFPRRHPGTRCRPQIEHELALIAELKLRALLPDRGRHRALRALRSTSSARAAARRPTRWSATASASPRSIRPRMSLLFERFISKERNEPPDIDVDFEHQRREEVIQYIYGKYGRAPRRAGGGRHQLPAARARCATSARRSASTSRIVERGLRSSTTGSTARRDLLNALAESGLRSGRRRCRSSGRRWRSSCWAFRATCRSIRAAS